MGFVLCFFIAVLYFFFYHFLYCCCFIHVLCRLRICRIRVSLRCVMLSLMHVIHFLNSCLSYCVILKTFDFIFTLKVWILRHWLAPKSKLQTLYRLFFEAGCLQKKKERGRGEKSGGKLTVHRLHSGGIRVVCVFADHCKTGPLWRRLPDCHSAGFSSLNKVGVSNRTSID